VLFGNAALLAAIEFTEAERARIPGFGHLLGWMNRLGRVRTLSPDQARLLTSADSE
jgi:hypothetical protein